MRTFLITGAGSGLGLAFSRAALDAGHRVVGTVRGDDALTAFNALSPERAIGRILHLDADSDTNASSLVDEVGPIDVVIANAGYGFEGAFEESSMADLRAQFEVNVFGAVALMKAVLPGMRERRRGHIVAVTSVAGLLPAPTLSFYAGSKFALEGITRSLAAEVARFGVRVTAVEPGAFRTEWSGRSMRRAARTIDDYGFVDEISAARAAFNGHQPGDPDRAAAAVMRLVEMDDPPTHLLLGSDALAAVTDGFQRFGDEVARYGDLTRSADRR
jgi:short-subunit dehydrogenase